MTTPKQYVNQIKKTPQPNKTLKKGITKTTTRNALTATNKQIQEANTKSISPLIKDNDLTSIMAKEENLKKIKHRYEHRITATNTQGKVLLTANIFNQTPQQAIRIVQKNLKKGTETHGPTHYQDPLNTKLENANITNLNQRNKGTIHKISIITILRKAK